MHLPLAIAFPILPSCSTSIGPLLNRVSGNRKKIRDRMEEESDEFHERVIRAYRELAEERTETRRPDRWANLAGYNREPNLECSLLNAFPISENIKLQRPNFKHPDMSFSADSALEYLQRAHKKNRLAHAYLISGPAGSGKSDVAARLAAALNKTTPEKVLQGAGTRRFCDRTRLAFAQNCGRSNSRLSSVLFNCAPPEIAKRLGSFAMLIECKRRRQTHF